MSLLLDYLRVELINNNVFGPVCKWFDSNRGFSNLKKLEDVGQCCILGCGHFINFWPRIFKKTVTHCRKFLVKVKVNANYMQFRTNLYVRRFYLHWILINLSLVTFFIYLISVCQPVDLKIDNCHLDSGYSARRDPVLGPLSQSWWKSSHITR